MTDDDLRAETSVADVVARLSPDGDTEEIEVEVGYALVGDDEVAEEYERVVVEYEVEDGVAFAKRVVPQAPSSDGNFVDAVGLWPNALRAVPVAEEAVVQQPGVEFVESIEDVLESCVSTGRHWLDGGEEA